MLSPSGNFNRTAVSFRASIIESTLTFFTTAGGGETAGVSWAAEFSLSLLQAANNMAKRFNRKKKRTVSYLYPEY
jgi:hypothetical protein